MKKADLVKLKNDSLKNELGLTADYHGIVLDANLDSADVLFFHPKIFGEYIIKKLDKSDLIIEKEKLPSDVENELFSDLDKVYKEAKDSFSEPLFKEFDKVQLTVEKECYSKYGIHKGAIGCVVNDEVVCGKVEVDFIFPEEAALYDDTVSVKISDIKSVK